EDSYVYLNDRDSGVNHPFSADNDADNNPDGRSKLVGSTDVFKIALGDVNKDGHLDIVFGIMNANAKNTLFINSKNGTFPSAGIEFGATRTYSIALGDVSGDHYLDVVDGTHYDQRSFVFENTTDPDEDNSYYDNYDVSSETTYKLGDDPNIDYDYAIGVGTTDLDSDGDLDVIVANRGEQKTYCFKNEGGKITSTNMASFGNYENARSLAFGDIDKDGDIDVLIGFQHNNDTATYFIRLFINEADPNDNPEPELVLSDETPNYEERGTAVNAVVEKFKEERPGGTLKVQITENAILTDRLFISNENGITFGPYTGGTYNIIVDPKDEGPLTIGTTAATSVSGASELIINFNASAIREYMEQVIESIAFENTSDDPTVAQRKVTFTFTDSGDNDGNGQLHTTADLQIDVTPINDPPTLTAFAGAVVTTTEDTEVEITFGELETQGDEADVDGTVVAFVVQSYSESNGTLKIGDDAASATAFAAGSNDTIDLSHQAYWTPDASDNALVNAFDVVAKDNDGDESTVHVTAQVSITAVPPTPTITGPASPTNNDPFDVTINFGETVTGFEMSDIMVSNGAASNLIDNGNGQYAATIDADSDGQVTVDVAANVVQDQAGNNNNAATQFTVDVDTGIPTPNITGPVSPTNSDPFDVTINFGETVTGFELADITVSNGAASNLIDNGNGQYTVTIDATSDGQVTVGVAANVVQDLAGNNNNSAPQFSVDVDTGIPTPNVTGPTSPTNSDPFDITIDFGETVTEFELADITVSNGAASNLIDNGNGQFTATIDASSDGQVTVDIAANVAQDQAGNNNNAASQF
ncbi:MAG: VCBS repeat-containing protein, partial [Planctomycetes bacterium]|nr:VCBS repeat-containing protein [Planctomycetota bacterium]